MHNDNTRSSEHRKSCKLKISKNISQKTLDKFENIEFIFTMGGCFLLCCTLGYQIYLFLKTGLWVGFSIIDALDYFNILWAKQPDNWRGIWNILNCLNPSYLFSFITIFIGLRLSDWNLEQKLAKMKKLRE